MDWSPDGRWVAYGYGPTAYTTELRIWDRTTGDKQTVTKPVLHDADPAFDLGRQVPVFYRDVANSTPFTTTCISTWAFPKGMKPYLLTLRADLPSPFVLKPGRGGGRTRRQKESGDKDSEDKEDKRRY